MSISKSQAPEANKATPSFGGRKVEVGACHDEFCDPLAVDIERHDAVWVIVDQLTKSPHFLAVRMTFTLEELCRLYICEIVWLHGVPVSIVSDMDPRFRRTFVRVSRRPWGCSG